MMNLPAVHPRIASQLEVVCQENIWVKKGAEFFRENVGAERDYPYSFVVAQSLTQLRDFFIHGNWAIRNGIVFGDLAFINQVNGGDEWWALKCFEDTWCAFDSISFSPIIQRGLFEDCIASLLALNIEDMPMGERYHQNWWEEDDDPPFDPADIEEEEPDPSALVASEKVTSMLWQDVYADFLCFVHEATMRFKQGDWGDLAQEDQRANELSNGFKMGEYTIPLAIKANGEKRLWIIYDGAVTTVLFPSEY